MDKFKKGDKVRYVGHPTDGESVHVPYLEGHVGTIVSDESSSGYSIEWDAPYPEMDFEPVGGRGRTVTWAQHFNKNGGAFEAVEPEYDQATVNAVLRHLREHGFAVTAEVVEREFAVPKTQKVVVEFQVDATFDLVAVLTDLEYAHEGIRFVDVKEDN